MAICIRIEGSAPVPIPRDGFRGLRILVAEDNAINQVVVSGLLQALGCDSPEVVGNGREALAAFREKQFDIVFMDCHMPDLDGYAATARIRRMEAGGGGKRRCYIAALTADIMPEVEEKCRAVGMDGRLAKPYLIDDLVATLERARARAAAGASQFSGRKEDKRDEWDDIDIRILDRLRLLGGKESPAVFRDLVRGFLEAVPERLSAIRESARAHEFKPLAFAAHGLKGLCLNFGALSMARECGALQAAANGERAGGLPDILERLTAAEAGARMFLEGMIGPEAANARTAGAGTPSQAPAGGNPDG